MVGGIVFTHALRDFARGRRLSVWLFVAGLTYGIGRLSNGFGPLIVAFLYKHYGYTSVFTYITVCWLVVALIIGVFGPRTNAKVLT